VRGEQGDPPAHHLREDLGDRGALLTAPHEVLGLADLLELLHGPGLELEGPGLLGAAQQDPLVHVGRNAARGALVEVALEPLHVLVENPFHGRGSSFVREDAWVVELKAEDKQGNDVVVHVVPAGDLEPTTGTFLLGVVFRDDPPGRQDELVVSDLVLDGGGIRADIHALVVEAAALVFAGALECDGVPHRLEVLLIALVGLLHALLGDLDHLLAVDHRIDPEAAIDILAFLARSLARDREPHSAQPADDLLAVPPEGRDDRLEGLLHLRLVVSQPAVSSESLGGEGADGDADELARREIEDGRELHRVLLVARIAVPPLGDLDPQAAPGIGEFLGSGCERGEQEEKGEFPHHHSLPWGRPNAPSRAQSYCTARLIDNPGSSSVTVPRETPPLRRPRSRRRPPRRSPPRPHRLGRHRRWPPPGSPRRPHLREAGRPT
jgi:hypothetical protein